MKNNELLNKETSMSLETKQAWDEKYWQNRALDDTKRDWSKESKDWIADYRGSVDHPHRDLIINTLSHFGRFKSLLELGCNAGPNLIKIRQNFSWPALAGVDASALAITEAKYALLDASLKVGLVQDIPFNHQFDVVLADAVLMYVPDVDIYHVMNEIDRVAKKYVIIVDWFNESELGEVVNFHWARNYTKLMNDMGFDVELIKLTEKDWPSPSWAKYGYVFVCKRR